MFVGSDRLIGIPAAPLPRVPCLWPGSPFVVCGAGPSLRQHDLDLIGVSPHGYKVIVVNDAYWLAPWADVLYAADEQWWLWHRDIPDRDLPSLKYCAQPLALTHRRSLIQLNIVRGDGIADDPTKLHSGGHGGHQAINLAVHLGASSIVLLGFDMQAGPAGQHHCHPEHPNGNHPTYLERLKSFPSLKSALDRLHIPIVNCTRSTAIPHSVIPRRPLAELLRY